MENNTISEITEKMRRIADIEQRNQANHPGANTVARCRKIERANHAAELRMLADEIDAAVDRLVSELTYNSVQELVDGLRGLVLTREQIADARRSLDLIEQALDKEEREHWIGVKQKQAKGATTKMKAWVEWKASQKLDIAIPPDFPNVFTTRENLVEFWKRTRFPADTVDWLFDLFDKSDRNWLEHDGYVAAEVEVDKYFVEKAKDACRADCPMRNTSKDGCKYYEGGNCTKVVTPTNTYAKCIHDLREKEKEDKPCII